jgi:hypothetical protein
VKRQFTTRLAWFRPHAPDASGPLDGTAGLVEALRARYDIDVIGEGQAHEFVWRHARQPYDLPVYELANTAAADFVWPYLFRYPGLLVARTRWLHDSRAANLRRQRRRADYAAELAFGGAPLLRAPLLASRLAAVSSDAHAQALLDEYPEARIRVAPPAVAAPGVRTVPIPAPEGGPVRVGVLSGGHLDVVNRALQRARDGGTPAGLVTGPPRFVLEEADIVVASRWMTAEDWPTAGLAAMAARRPAVVMETEATADWPALDPQTWQPRDPLRPDPPVAVSIDPRDEEHSLVLAIRRLAADPDLRAALAAAGFAWWSARAAPDRAAGTWADIIDEAVALPAPAIPAGWPPHLRADGSDTARDILVHIGAGTDIFDWTVRRSLPYDSAACNLEEPTD